MHVGMYLRVYVYVHRPTYICMYVRTYEFVYASLYVKNVYMCECM